MIRVCDAIMGTGKTQGAIRYMNDNKDEKFIYVSPFLEEARRIKDGCPDLNFIEPSNKIEEFGFRKQLHTHHLIKQGRNITTTHQSLMNYKPDMLDDIKEKGYTLIIDESINTLVEYILHGSDREIALESGFIKLVNDSYVLTDKVYDGNFLKDIIEPLKTRKLVEVGEVDKKSDTLLYWVFSHELITSFKDVIILTYLFKGQNLYRFFQMNDIDFTFCGIQKDKRGHYICDGKGYIPDYVETLKHRINILDSDKMNEVGDSRTALSMSWFKRNNRGVSQLKNNTYNYFNNIWRSVPAERKLWGSYKDGQRKLSGAGYKKRFLPFNSRSTNAYNKTDVLVYAVNIFPSGNENIYFSKHGIDVDEEAYALSTMVQWIWRSSIREGQPVNLYLPSSRMRRLLNEWLERLSKGEL